MIHISTWRIDSNRVFKRWGGVCQRNPNQPNPVPNPKREARSYTAMPKKKFFPNAMLNVPNSDKCCCNGVVMIIALHGAHGDEGFNSLALSSSPSDAGWWCIVDGRERRGARVHDVIAAGCRRNSGIGLENGRRSAPLRQRVGLGRCTPVAWVARLRSA